MPNAYKFAFISGCLVIALVSYFWRKGVKDWALLVAGLVFTLVADYFLVLRDWHLAGVAAFCFVHFCYIFRAVPLGGERERRLSRLFVVVFVVVWFTAVVLLGNLFLLAGLYAALFCFNLFVNFYYRASRLVLVGLVLFALCDINVALFNLPIYFGWAAFEGSYRMIWVFYLPSQVLIALSGFSKICKVS